MDYITVGGQEEEHQIEIDLSEGSFTNCEYINGSLMLTTDERGQYYAIGHWVSEIIELKDRFKEFNKMIFESVDTNKATQKIYTRVSNDKIYFSEWVKLDGNKIQQDESQYIQVRIELFAGYTVSTKETNFVDVVLEDKVKDYQYFTSDKDGIKLSEFVSYKVKKSSITLEEGLVSEVEINIDDFETVSNFNFTVQ